MRNRRLRFLALSSILLLFPAAASQAALSTYLTLEGPDGAIEGDVTIQGREGTIEVLEFHHMVSIPTDPNTGQQIGERRYQPFIFTKRIDKASPLLLRALARGEHLPKATFRFYRINHSGMEEHYYTIEFLNVMVVALEPLSPNNHDPDNQSFPHMERVRLAFAGIIQRWEPDAIEFEDETVPRP